MTQTSVHILLKYRRGILHVSEHKQNGCFQNALGFESVTHVEESDLEDMLYAFAIQKRFVLSTVIPSVLGA